MRVSERDGPAVRDTSAVAAAVARVAEGRHALQALLLQTTTVGEQSVYKRLYLLIC